MLSLLQVLCIAFLTNVLSLPLTATNFYALNYNYDDSANPNIKMVLFRTGAETPEQIALVPKIKTVAMLYGANSIEERELPASDVDTYQSSANQALHTSWYKMQVTREVMDANPQTQWILTFELSALPTDGSAAINFAALINTNPSVAVFLKRTGSGFGMSMFKNDKETRAVVEKIWGKRSAKSSVAVAFASFSFWNPSILSKVKFL